MLLPLRWEQSCCLACPARTQEELERGRVGRGGNRGEGGGEREEGEERSKVKERGKGTGE